jgi:hexosaminidase
LLGGEACLWSEHCPPERVWYQMLPRAQAVAESLWSPAAGKSWEGFLPRSRAHTARLRAMGIEPGPEKAGTAE